MQRERKPDSAAEKLDVSRPRLDALFAAAVQTPLVVVNAGAGFGKSRAAWQYLSRSAYRTVWLGFAKLDNNPARFWEHLS